LTRGRRLSLGHHLHGRHWRRPVVRAVAVVGPGRAVGDRGRRLRRPPALGGERGRGLRADGAPPAGRVGPRRRRGHGGTFAPRRGGPAARGGFERGRGGARGGRRGGIGAGAGGAGRTGAH